MKVLIVEDRPELARLLVRYLRAVACDIVVAINREQATEIIRSTNPLDLITIDLGLPDSTKEDSIEWLKELRELRPNSVVVVLSGVVSREEEGHVLDAGADGFLSKPDAAVDQLTFLERLAQIGRSMIAQPKRYSRNIDVAEAMANRFTAYITANS